MNTIYSPYDVDLEKLMSNEDSWNTFAEKFIKLPATIKDLVLIRGSEVLWPIAYALNFSEPQAAQLSRTVRDVLLGDLFIGDMASVVATEIGLDQKTAEGTVNKIAKELFAPAIEDIKQIQREKFPNRVGQRSTNTINQPPTPPQMKNTPEINLSNVIDLRNNAQS